LANTGFQTVYNNIGLEPDCTYRVKLCIGNLGKWNSVIWNETRRIGAIFACFYVARVWQRQLGFLVHFTVYSNYTYTALTPTLWNAADYKDYSMTTAWRWQLIRSQSCEASCTLIATVWHRRQLHCVWSATNFLQTWDLKSGLY